MESDESLSMLAKIRAHLMQSNYKVARGKARLSIQAVVKWGEIE